jgi:hypothetical protein
MTEVDGEVWVRDLGSTNGTWIDGRRVSSGRVRIGDVLAIAHLCYRVEEINEEPACRANRPSTHDDGRISLGDLPGRGLSGET